MEEKGLDQQVCITSELLRAMGKDKASLEGEL